MKCAIARKTLNKARYFLDHAEMNQSDPKITADRLPFSANLEAAIIYGRSVLDHLRNEFTPSDPTYRGWHDARWQLLQSNPLFKRFSDRRNFIIHREPEETNVTVAIDVELQMNLGMSIQVTVVRADGTIEPQGAVSANSAKQPESEERARSKTTQTFHLSDPDWRTKSAIDYVREFLNLIEPVVTDAEARFLK